MAQLTLCWWFWRFVTVYNHNLILVHFGSDNLFKVALYGFFGARGIGTNGARVFKKKFYFDEVTKRRVLIDLRMHITRFPDGEFFDSCHMCRLFLSLAVRKK